jgi:hypothetical protein
VTTAPTPEEVHALAARLEHCVVKWGKQNALSLEAYSAVKMMRRLQAENERLQGSLDAQRLISDRAIALAKELEAHKPLPLSDEQIDAIADGMPGGLGGFLKTWGWRQFARKILDLRAPPTWEPQFDAMESAQEALAVQFCIEIAGLRGQKGSPPDPVRLLEMAEALYKAEADAQLVDKSPNLQEPLVDKTAKLQDRPEPLSDDDRLHLRSDVARAIWDVMREHEDRCGHALEDVEPKHQVWDCADAAIRAMKDKP